MQPFKDTLNFPTSLPKDIEESILDFHERLKNISDFDEINAIELEWKLKFREHFKIKQQTESNLNTLIDNSSFPFLAANLNCNNCDLISNNIKPYIIKEIA